MGLVTVFCPLTMTEAGELVVQIADESRLVEECRVKPVELAGQVKITFTPEAITVSCGGPTGNERLNAVPYPRGAASPPLFAVPYRVLPDKINSAYGKKPSLLVVVFGSGAVKLYRIVKPVPSVLRANTVPLPELPPPSAVPYRMLFVRIKPAYG